MQSAEFDSLSHLLSDLRSIVYHPRPKSGVAPLDRLLEVFCTPTQNVPAQPRSPLNQGEIIDRREYHGHPPWPLEGSQNPSQRWKPTIIEVSSLLPASGKTQFLYHIVAHAILPSSHGGQGTAVVWLDTDGRFSATRLRDVVLGLVPSAAADEDEIGSLAHEALTHVHLFYPQSSQQLIDTLDHLPSHLFNPAAHHSISKRLGLLTLDSATAFYWQDRLETATARFAHPDEPRSRASPTTEVITRLKRLRKEFDCAVLFSTSSTGMTAARRTPVVPVDAGNTAPQENRSVSPWTFFATLTLRISRVKVKPFAEHMKLEQCLEDRESRKDAVLRGKFHVEADSSGSDLWTASLKEAWGRMEDRGRFEIRIGEGVVS